MVDDDMGQDPHVTAAQGMLGKLFMSCQKDPRGSVHRAWGISLLFVVLYFVVAVIESEFFFGFVCIRLIRLFYDF